MPDDTFIERCHKELITWLDHNRHLSGVALPALVIHEVEAAIKGDDIGTLQNAVRATRQFDEANRTTDWTFEAARGGPSNLAAG